MTTQLQIVFDAADPARIAEFWAAALGYEPQPPPPGYDEWPAFLREINVPEEQWNDISAINDPAGERPRIYIQRVPEPKTQKNRLHLDLQVGAGKPPEERHALVTAEVARVSALGATKVEERTNAMGEYWVVMLDPEGNEFCVS